MVPLAAIPFTHDRTLFINYERIRFASACIDAQIVLQFTHSCRLEAGSGGLPQLLFGTSSDA
jgi:hypothetical protein